MAIMSVRARDGVAPAQLTVEYGRLARQLLQEHHSEPGDERGSVARRKDAAAATVRVLFLVRARALSFDLSQRGFGDGVFVENEAQRRERSLLQHARLVRTALSAQNEPSRRRWQRVGATTHHESGHDAHAVSQRPSARPVAQEEADHVAREDAEDDHPLFEAHEKPADARRCHLADVRRRAVHRETARESVRPATDDEDREACGRSERWQSCERFDQRADDVQRARDQDLALGPRARRARGGSQAQTKASWASLARARALAPADPALRRRGTPGSSRAARRRRRTT